ncbi:MAG: Gfo/Idh/MocA family oxidoreductase [Candidatus Altiarchaeota archaeon]
MKTIRAAVVGVGAMGKNHARVYAELEGVELAAVADIDEERAKRISDKYRCRHYADYRKMLSGEDLDVVSVVVPTNSHTRIALECIGRGVNVLVEKPIADTVENAEKMISAARKNKVKLSVGHVERFNPAVVELKRRLDAGELGRIFKVACVRVGPFPERIRDVGVVVDLATHELDIMRYLVGAEFKRVYAESERRIHTTHEDLLNAVLKFENDVVGTLDVNWLTPEKIRELSVVGEEGMFVLKYLTQDLFFYEKVEGRLEGYDYSDILMGVAGGNVVDLRISKTEPLKSELSSFIDCVRDDERPRVSGEDGLEALKVAYALIDSSKRNKVISL